MICPECRHDADNHLYGFPCNAHPDCDCRLSQSDVIRWNDTESLHKETEALRAENARLRECVRLSEIYITSLEDFIAGETSFFVSEIRSLVDEKQAYTRAREAVG